MPNVPLCLSRQLPSWGSALIRARRKKLISAEQQPHRKGKAAGELRFMDGLLRETVTA
jgi:hypothetical protein